MVLDQIVVQGLLFLHTYIRNGGGLDSFDEDYRTLAIVIFLLMQPIECGC